MAGFSAAHFGIDATGKKSAPGVNQVRELGWANRSGRMICCREETRAMLPAAATPGGSDLSMLLAINTGWSTQSRHDRPTASSARTACYSKQTIAQRRQ
jgi:hypothetical protein